jgi:hypothetical protein
MNTVEHIHRCLNNLSLLLLNMSMLILCNFLYLNYKIYQFYRLILVAFNNCSNICQKKNSENIQRKNTKNTSFCIFSCILYVCFIFSYCVVFYTNVSFSATPYAHKHYTYRFFLVDSDLRCSSSTVPYIGV